MLPFAICVASLSWYLGEGDLKIGSERVGLLADCFLSSAGGHLEGEKWACSYLMVTPLPLLCLAFLKAATSQTGAAGHHSALQRAPCCRRQRPAFECP